MRKTISTVNFTRKLGHPISERDIVELTVLIGCYNMHTSTFQALAVDLEDAP